MTEEDDWFREPMPGRRAGEESREWAGVESLEPVPIVNFLAGLSR